jgi:hypothetical protein
MTTVNDMLYQLGGLPALPPLPIAPGGTWYWVDPVNGSASNDGLAPVLDNAGHGPLLTIAAAYAKTTDLHHDVVVLLEGASPTIETATITWSNSYTHLIGFCAPVREGQRARITQLSTATGVTHLFTLSGSGCVWANVRIVQEVNDATSLGILNVTGERNYFWNVDFAGGAHSASAIDGGCSVRITGGSELFFDRCTFGLDTVAWATGFAGLVYAATGGAARNVFRDCLFNASAGNANAIFVELLGNSGLDRYHIFDRCIFQNLSSTAMTEAFKVAAGFDPANKRVLLRDCALIGATDWDSNNRGILYLNNGTITGGGNAGLFAVSNST